MLVIIIKKKNISQESAFQFYKTGMMLWAMQNFKTIGQRK